MVGFYNFFMRVCYICETLGHGTLFLKKLTFCLNFDY
jgi:hypothetical protein